MGAFDDSKSSDLTRGSSLRASVRFSTSQRDDDDYDMQAMAVADGFRPVDATNTQTPRPATTPQDVPMAQIPPPRPSSITKPHRRSGSLALQHDGSSSESDCSRSLSRVSSGSTASPFVDAEDPYDGPSGPSHPYQMYPQDVRVARTASLATTSTAPVSERSYNGPRGPAHPYGMYPQNTVPETGGIPGGPVQAEINVGFPGATDNYQRRIGPDGEDVADLIGPDGHTEQLPPYTRYPEEAYTRKALGVELPQPAPVQPMLAIPGAGGIGMATRNPEFASTEDLGGLSSPQSRQSIRSFTSENSRNELHATATPDKETIDEKRLPKDWHVTAKRRVWGIVPCWAIVLAAIVLVLMGVILGAVIGTLLRPDSKDKSHKDGPSLPMVNPSNWDTQPLSTLPSDLPPLQEGDFSLPLRNNRMSNTCFSDSTLAQAWNCDLFFFQLGMKIRRLPGEPETSDYSLGFFYNESATLQHNVYLWGMQPPQLSDVRLKLVNDMHESPRGPAWNFEVAYNKTVIVPDHALSTIPSSSPSALKRRRTLYGGGFKRKGAQVGDRIWICRWDNTILEAFIYANQNNSIRPMASPPPPTTTENIPSGLTTLPGAAVTGPPGEGIENGGELRPSDAPYGGPQDHHTPTPGSDGPPNLTTTSSTPTSSSISDQDFPMPKNYPPVYPRVIKVEEHRNTNSATPKPWCRQFQIDDNNEAQAVKVDGKVVDIIIDEDEGEFGPGPPKDIIIERHLGGRGGIKMGSDMSDCGCMWWLS